jgi:hypothetical protein
LSAFRAVAPYARSKTLDHRLIVVGCIQMTAIPLFFHLPDILGSNRLAILNLVAFEFRFAPHQ